MQQSEQSVAMEHLKALVLYCILAAVPALVTGSSSASSSSLEDGMDLQEAAVERCVREATPDMIADGTYDNLMKIDTCVNDGLNALEDGKAPSAVAQQIVDCVNGKPFPDALQPVVDAFKGCVLAALP